MDAVLGYGVGHLAFEEVHRQGVLDEAPDDGGSADLAVRDLGGRQLVEGDGDQAGAEDQRFVQAVDVDVIARA